MQAVFKDLVSSKKAIAAIAGLLTVIANSLGLTGLSEESLMQILGVLGAFMVGQGIADNGKEAAKITNGK